MELVLMLLLVLVISMIFGALIGASIVLIKLNRITTGTLHLETSDPDGPYFFLELDQNLLPIIEKQKYITLKIDTKSYISQN